MIDQEYVKDSRRKLTNKAKEWRKGRSISADELSRISNMSTDTIRRIENNDEVYLSSFMNYLDSLGLEVKIVEKKKVNTEDNLIDEILTTTLIMEKHMEIIKRFSIAGFGKLNDKGIFIWSNDRIIKSPVNIHEYILTRIYGDKEEMVERIMNCKLLNIDIYKNLAFLGSTNYTWDKNKLRNMPYKKLNMLLDNIKFNNTKNRVTIGK